MIQICQNADKYFFKDVKAAVKIKSKELAILVHLTGLYELDLRDGKYINKSLKIQSGKMQST